MSIYERITTKPGYKILLVLLIIIGFFYVHSITGPTIYVDEYGYVYKVNDKYLDVPSKNPEIFRESGKIIYDKQ